MMPPYYAISYSLTCWLHQARQLEDKMLSARRRDTLCRRASYFCCRHFIISAQHATGIGGHSHCAAWLMMVVGRHFISCRTEPKVVAAKVDYYVVVTATNYRDRQRQSISHFSNAHQTLHIVRLYIAMPLMPIIAHYKWPYGRVEARASLLLLDGNAWHMRRMKNEPIYFLKYRSSPHLYAAL